MVQSLKEELDTHDGSMEQAFRSLDLDDDGVLSYEELMLAMDSINQKKRPRAAQLKQVLDKLDPDADGQINVSDLRSLVLKMEMRDDLPQKGDPPKQATHK